MPLMLLLLLLRWRRLLLLERCVMPLLCGALLRHAHLLVVLTEHPLLLLLYRVSLLCLLELRQEGVVRTHSVALLLQLMWR